MSKEVSVVLKSVMDDLKLAGGELHRESGPYVFVCSILRLAFLFNFYVQYMLSFSTESISKLTSKVLMVCLY